MELIGYIASIFIGVSLGMVGSGGSILTVPVLVYLMSVNPLVATTSSLFIFLTRHYLLPALPDTFFTIGGLIVSKEMLLMVVFAILMLAASLTMIRSHETEVKTTESETIRHNKVLPLILLGLCIGVITGLLGAGGGFLIIPTLVLFLKLPMKIAVGTSLLIIAINSLFGFLFSLKQFEYNWTLIISFTVLSIAGLFIGSKIADKVSGTFLKKGFGWFVLVMGVYIIAKEIFFS